MAGRQGRMDRLGRLGMFSYPEREPHPPSPREKATFLSVLFSTWLFPLIKIGMRRELTEKDLQPTLREDQSDIVGDKLEVKWGDYLERCKKKGTKPKLPRFIVKMFGLKFFLYGLFSLAEETIFRMMQVIAMGYVMDYFEGNHLTTKTGTILFGVGGIVLGFAAFNISFHWSVFNLHHVCIHIRIGLTSLVYRKLLHLNQTSLRASTVGQLITMIASDLHRFDRKHVQVNYLWIAPIHLGVVIYMLYFHYDYGPVSLIGLGVLASFTCIQYVMARKFLQMRKVRVDSSDERIRVVVELINAFHTIKVHCWESFFQREALESRKREIKYLRTTMFLRLLNTSIGFIVTKMSLFLTLLISFIFDSNMGLITSKRIFVTLVLYEHVNLNAMWLFPQAIHDLAELLASCKRIERFLVLEELSLPALRAGGSSGSNVRTQGCTPFVQLSNLSCRWTDDEGSFRLSNVTLTATPGQLLVIAGPIASGKTTLLSAILGEMVPESGHVMVVGRMAYVPQVPSIFPGSVRRNIVFGYGYNSKWYHEVIKLCDLISDLHKLPAGDQSLTEVTQLTTSQKSKICLARAVYANAQVYLLDDPFHSMDVKHHSLLLDTVIRGALADKVVILVTHQIHFFEGATRILLVKDGKVQAHGRYSDLVKAGIEFHKDKEYDDFYYDDADEDGQTMTQHDLVPEVIQPRDLRRRYSIHVDINNKSNIRVSQSPAVDPVKLEQTAQRRDLNGINHGTINAVAMVAVDEDAYDARDKIMSPTRIGFGLYFDFLLQGASIWKLLLFLFICVITQCLYTGTDYWIEHWAAEEEVRLALAKQQNIPATPVSPRERAKNISIYSILTVLIMVGTFGRSFFIFKICMKASAAVFEKLLSATLQVRMHYFETTCAGHAINRLSKDMVIIDDLIPPTLLEVCGVVFEIFGITCLLAYANPWFIIPCVVFILVDIVIYKMYHLSAADLKRIEGNARSPVYSHLSQTLQGVTTIRAFGQEQAFVMMFDRLQDLHTASFYLFLSCQNWLAIMVDAMNLLLVAVITTSFFIQKDVDAPIVGLSICKLVELTILIEICAEEMSNTETQMISVERVLEYTESDNVDQFELFHGPQPPENWPAFGKIEMRNFSVSMNPFISSERQLRRINLKIQPGEWIGIVGRAGSGKTTLLNSLLRITEPCGGSAFIDDIDITSIGLHSLRSRISVIPQNPCMFGGTIRQNIDPLEQFTDEQIWTVLEECTLMESYRKLEKGLESVVSEYGTNFSAGERQLICLARVLLEKNRILCCDEPTSCLDSFSQILILDKMKEAFADCTVLLVAHRTPVVVQCDRILVLDSGEIIEQGSPVDLLERKKGAFHDLIRHLGTTSYNEVLELARQVKQNKANSRTTKAPFIGDAVMYKKPAAVAAHMKKQKEKRHRSN